MKKKAIFLMFGLLFLSGCNFKPIFSLSDTNFSINEFFYDRSNKIDKKIVESLKIYSIKKNKKKNISLKIDSTKNISIASKDSKGNPNKYSMNIGVLVEIIENSISIKKKVFNESFIYSNTSNKFDLRTYENNIERNLTESILEKISLYLYNF